MPRYLEAVIELLGDEEEDDGIDAGVDGGHVDAEVVEHQQEAATTGNSSFKLKAHKMKHEFHVSGRTSGARSAERPEVCRRFSSAGGSGGAGTSRGRRSPPGRTRL